MKNINILPADTYMVVNRTILSENDRQIISMLYQPIIGSTAVSLFYTLWSDLDKTNILSNLYTHHHLMTSLRLKLDIIIAARKKLEAIGLLKSFINKENVNTYVYELFSPVSASVFFNHPILNVILFNNIGKKEYEYLLSYFKIPKINLSNYEEITSSFDSVFESVPMSSLDNLNEDLKVNKTGKLTIDEAFDFDLLISSIPSGIISNKAFTKEVKELINNLSFVYNLDAIEMKSSIINSIKENGLIDKTLLRKNVKNYYKFENENKLPSLVYKSQPEYLKNTYTNEDKRSKMIYVFENTSPYKFLKGRSNGAKPSSHDLNLLESLLTDFKLNPGVVNVLIDYVLKINNKKLTRTYLETIASQWKRLNIQTVEDAMKEAEKEYKKNNKVKDNYKQTSVKEELPDWFNKNITKEKMDDKDEKSLKDMLKEFS